MPASSPPDLKSALAILLRGGREALKLGSFDLAETLAREVLALDATNADANVIIGRALFYKNNHPQAAMHLALGLQANAEPEVWIELARAHQFQRQWDKAIAAFQASHQLRAPTAVQEAELGHAFSNNKQFAEAAAAFVRASVLEPKNAEIWNDLGAMQLELGDLKTAQRSFETAVGLKPDDAQALSNLGLVHEFQGNGRGAIEAAERLAVLRPSEPAAIQKRAVVRLSQGHLVSGWTDYRARFTNPAHKGWHVGIPKPMWDGVSSLSDKGILVWSDQGLGDQILTASVLPDVVAAAKHVVFSCEPRLAALIQRSFPSVRAVSLFDVPLRRVDLSDTDVQASISELGPAFRPDLQRFPKHSGYLKADPDKVIELKARYAALPGPGEKGGPIVGVSWQSINELARGNKSIALDQWGPILKTPGVRFVCLQYGDVAREIAASGANIFIDRAVDPISDVDTFAAQVAAMDMVISTSNTTVHMAGALSVPTLCLTPLVEGRPWYWFVGRDTSPWYPSVRHIWQTKRREWGDVVERAADGLVNLIPN